MTTNKQARYACHTKPEGDKGQELETQHHGNHESFAGAIWLWAGLVRINDVYEPASQELDQQSCDYREDQKHYASGLMGLATH